MLLGTTQGIEESIYLLLYTWLKDGLGVVIYCVIGELLSESVQIFFPLRIRNDV